jgi:uncharacterized protein (DUF1501 family)
MAITRRQFLVRTGALTAGALAGPGLWQHPFVRRAMADTIGDRFLVVVFLDGGNDGLNTVTPVTNGGGSLRTAYEAARKTGAGGIRLDAGALGATLIGTDPNTGAQLALHPGLGGLKALWDPPYQRLAVIQGVGYPEYSLSHEEARVIWQTANPLRLGSLTGSGWCGRHLALNYGSTDIPGVSIEDTVAPELRQYATSVLAIRRLRQFGFPYDDAYPGDAAAKRAAFAALSAAAGAGAQPTDAYVGDTGAATLTSSESYPPLDSLYRTARPGWNAAYDALDRSTARDLREVAKIIYGVLQGVPNVHARFFRLSNGGYDTHSDQGGAETTGQHYAILSEVGDALKLFYDDLADMGAADKVLVLVYSEFSRRIPQNDNGTDHGSQGPMFVLGGAVNGGVYGNHPNIDPLALDDGGNTPYTQGADPFRSTDFRDVYGTVLKHWLNMPAAQITASVLPPDAGAPASYWTAPDFDLGFL